MTSQSKTNGIAPETTSVPTLFRIPELGGGQQPAASDAQSAPLGDESVPTERADAMTRRDSASPLPAKTNRDDSGVRQYSTGAASYDSLPELPPLEEPAGRTWMETVGSRVVLALLFLAIGTVAIMATRDVPPIAGSTELADDDLHLDVDLGSAERVAQVSQTDMTADQVLSIDQGYPAESSIPAPATELIPEAELGNAPPVAGNPTDQAMLIPALELSPSGTDTEGLPSIDQIEDGPEAGLPSIPALPGFADNESIEVVEPVSEGLATDSDQAPGTKEIRSNPLAVDMIGPGISPADASAENGVAPETEALAGAGNAMDEAEAIVAKLEQPAGAAKETLADYRDAWKNTVTPEAVGSWKDFQNQPATPVGYNQQVPGENQPISAQSSGINQFGYPGQPVQPNSLAPSQPFAPAPQPYQQQPYQQQQIPQQQIPQQQASQQQQIPQGSPSMGQPQTPYFNPYQAQQIPQGMPTNPTPQSQPGYAPYQGPSAQLNSPANQGLVYIPGQGHVRPGQQSAQPTVGPTAPQRQAPGPQQNLQPNGAWNGYVPPINYGQPATTRYPAPGQYYPGTQIPVGSTPPQN